MLFEGAPDLFGRKTREIVFDKQFIARRLHPNSKKAVYRMYAGDILQIIAIERTRKFKAGLHFRHRESE